MAKLIFTEKILKGSNIVQAKGEKHFHGRIVKSNKCENPLKIISKLDLIRGELRLLTICELG